MWKCDEEFKTFMKYLENGADTQTVAVDKRKKYQNLEGHYRVHEGLLYHRNLINGESVSALVVPLKFREKILHEFHNKEESGHRGFRPTLARIRRNYF